MAEPTAPRRRLRNPAIFVCDLQEKFRGAIHEFDKVILTTTKVLKAAQALQIPIYVTTQNKARLGDIVPELLPYLDTPLCKVQADKTLFSMWTAPIASHFPPPVPNNAGDQCAQLPAEIAILGIESHICVTQTALDALARGHRAYVLADAVSSCNREEVPLALARLRAEGAVVTSSEGWLYECVGDAGVPEFKSVVGVVKESMADTRAALGALQAPAVPKI